MSVKYTRQKRFLLAAICGALIFFFASCLLVEYTLPKELVLTQDVTFQLPEDVPFHSDQWSRFALDQEISFVDKLGEVQTAIGEQNISFAYCGKALIVTFRYQGKIYLKVVEDFERLIEKYVDTRLILQAGQQNKISCQPDSFEVFTMERLEKLTQEKEQLQDEICLRHESLCTRRRTHRM